MKAIEYNGDLKEFLRQYNYQPDLTNRLDNINDTPFGQHLINEIVLWKVNRYVSFTAEILQKIESVKSINHGQHREGQAVLETLLKVHGVDIPMASVFLRFRNPRVFQIIDRHAYRAVYGQKYPLNSATRIDQKILTYFDCLDKLIELCKAKKLDFQTIDRLLYKFDKEINGKL